MKYWVIALLVLTALVIGGGCSSSAPEMSAALAPVTDASGSGTRIASALNWGAPTVLESSPPHCTVGMSSAIIGGNPAVSYMIWSDQGQEPGFTIYYARANDPNGTSWGNPVAVNFWPYSHDYDNWTSLCEVNGRPAIAYQSFPNGMMYNDVRFVRAKDAVGNTWGTPVIVDPYDDDWFDFQGDGTTLKMVNGNPAIEYMDGGSHKYVRASNPNGSRWGTPQIIRGTFTILNGYPTLSYTDGGILYLRRAADANGDSWLDPVAVVSGTSFGAFSIVNGNPALTYSDNGELYYCRAADPYGDSWCAPVDLCNTNGLSHSFAIVNGNPAVSYTDGGGVLYFRRAADADGDSWGEVTTVLANVAPANQKRLFVVAGCPAIAFSGTSDKPLSSIRFVRALDPDGISWPSTAVDVTVRGDASIEFIGFVVFINGLPTIFFNSGINVAAEGEPAAYDTTYFNSVQALDTAGNTWETPETILDFADVFRNPSMTKMTFSETGAGIAYSSWLHAMNFKATFPAPPDPVVNVQLSTDKSNYVSGEDDLAVLTAVVTDEYGYPISGLGLGSFATTLNGSGVTVTFSESATAGTYTGNLYISGLSAGDYTAQTTVTDARQVSGSDSATFTMYEPGSGGTMHVGDLDIIFDVGAAGKWRAVFSAKIEDSSESPVSGAEVYLSFSGDLNGSLQLPTGSDGTVSFHTGWRRGSATYTLTAENVTHVTKTYNSADNHDPDGDFPDGGNSITVSGP